MKHVLLPIDGSTRSLRTIDMVQQTYRPQDTEVTLSVSQADADFLAGVDLASLCIVSKVTVTTGAVEGEKSEDCLIPCTIAVALDESPKCPRCWKHSTAADENGLCPRCASVIAKCADFGEV